MSNSFDLNTKLKNRISNQSKRQVLITESPSDHHPQETVERKRRHKEENESYSLAKRSRSNDWRSEIYRTHENQSNRPEIAREKFSSGLVTKINQRSRRFNKNKNRRKKNLRHVYHDQNQTSINFASTKNSQQSFKRSKIGETISSLNCDNQNHPVIQPLSYTALKNLCDDQLSPEEASSKLSEYAQLQRFEALLKENEIRYDLMKLIISAIYKVCQSRIESHLNTIIAILNKVRFWSILGIFIAEMETNNKCLSDPDISSIIQHLCKIFSISLELLPHLYSSIPLSQLNNAVSFFKDKQNVSLDTCVEGLLKGMADKCELTKQSIREKQLLVEPPDDFRTLSVFPTEEDIFKKGKPFLRENIVKKPFSTVNQYLDIHFRLLKEDSLAGLRNGIRDFQRSYKNQQYGKAAVNSLSSSNNARHQNDVTLYHDVNINELVVPSRGQANITKGIVYNVSFNSAHRSVKHVNWKRSKRLMFGALVCLISTDFKKVYFATVQDRNPEMLKEGYIQLCFEENPDYDDMQEEYHMVESSSAYFVAYRHILERLQNITDETMPFKKYIVFCEHEIDKPAYFKSEGDNTKTFNLESVKLEGKHSQLVRLKDDDRTSRLQNVNPYDLSTWPDGDVIGLNESQYKAFQSALRREFCVIQGPPGTGKTYLGLKIAHTLLDNNHLWKEEDDMTSCPILMLAYTNHALDSFLEGLSINRRGIIRIGGRSSSDALAKCNIKEVRKERRNAEFQNGVRRRGGRRFHEVEREKTQCQAELNNYTELYAKSFKGILPAREFERWIPNEHRYMLSEKNLMLEFLGISLNPTAEQEAAKLEDEEGLEDFYEHDLGGHFSVGRIEEDEAVESKSEVLICLAEETSSPEGMLELLKSDVPDIDETENLQERTGGEELFSLSVEQRWSLYLLWIARLREYLRGQIRQKQAKYLNLSREYEELRNIEDLNIMRNSRVVGMTTTCASRNHNLLRQLRPRVVIIEEAAEIFEAHIVACLTKSCQHLILIGDHQQLRPNPSVYNLSVKYSLDVSLLERMIEAGVPYNRLSVQHRMRPEISKLLRLIYDGLEDHESVMKYENIRGVSKNVFFINHEFRESVHDNVHSKVNQHEAEFLVQLCLYLLRQGYKSSQITILTTYTGQIFVIRDLIKSKKEEFQDIFPRVSSVDNFQGEENDIVLLSLVRNNEDENIGFLKTSNRVCVALSRARKGFYIIGNKTMLSNQSSLWKEVLADLDKSDFVGKSLPLRCSNHQTSNLVSSAADFLKLAPNGGCIKRCQHRLECGHACPQMCHPFGHEDFKCEKPCMKNVSGCRVFGHKCTKLCYEICDRFCQYPVVKTLICKHQITLACSVDVNTAKCVERCEKILECNHRCQAKCSAACTKQCMELIKKTDLSCGHENTMACSAVQKDCRVPCSALLECGHPCVGKCGQCIQGRVHVKCEKKCERNLICSHQCESRCTKDCPPCKKKCARKCNHSKCKKLCGEICIPCQEQCEWKCEHHECSRLCSEMCDRPRCNEPCKKKIRCGKGKVHPCRGLCGERCICSICDTNKGKDVKTIFFGTEDEDDARFIMLEDCKHIFEYTALDQMMDNDNIDDGIKLKVCPLCTVPIVSSLRYGNVIKKVHHDVDNIKKKILGSIDDWKEKEALVRKMESDLCPEIVILVETEFPSKEKIWKKFVEYVNRCISKPQAYCQDILLLESQISLLHNWLVMYKSYRKALNESQSAVNVEFYSEIQHLLYRILESPMCTNTLAQLNVELQRLSLKKNIMVLNLNCTIDYPEDRDWKRYCFTRVAYATSVIRLYVLVTTVTNLEITAKMHFFINKGENLKLISVFLYS